MVIFRLAYRHDNGEIEGFAGCGFSAGAAERDAVNKARRKAESIGKEFRQAQLVRHARDLRAGETETVLEDWKISERGAA